MEFFTMWCVPALVGVVIGVLSGMLGIGGGTVMVPVFRLAFDMSAIASTATSLFTIIPTSISGAVSHLRHKTCILPLGIACGVGGALTSPVGVWLASISQPWMIMVAAALIIGYSAVNMLRKALAMGPKKAGRKDSEGSNGAGAASAASSQPAADDVFSLSRRQLAIGTAIGLGAGLASGYVGVGGGFIMVPLMLTFIGIPMKKASGTSLIAVMILAIPGVIEHALLGNINYIAGIAVAIGTIPGAVLGANLVRRVPERALRFLFGGFLLVAAALLVVNETGVLG